MRSIRAHTHTLAPGTDCQSPGQTLRIFQTLWIATKSVHEADTSFPSALAMSDETCWEQTDTVLDIKEPITACSNTTSKHLLVNNKMKVKTTIKQPNKPRKRVSISTGNAGVKKTKLRICRKKIYPTDTLWVLSDFWSSSLFAGKLDFKSVFHSCQLSVSVFTVSEALSDPL